MCTVYFCERCTGNFTLPNRDRGWRRCPDCSGRIRPWERTDPMRPALPIDWPIDQRVDQLREMLDRDPEVCGFSAFRRWVQEELDRLATLPPPRPHWVRRVLGFLFLNPEP